MPKVQKVAGKVQLEVERFDGGRNVKNAPSDLSPFESPDELNVTYDDQGSVQTRQGTTTLNTQAVGSAPIDGLASYNGSMVAWAGGDMFRLSGTTFVTIPSGQSQFASGVKIAHTQYQNVLFCSDGTSAFRYTGDGLYQHGIAVPPNSAVVTASTGSGPNSGLTYYYKVAYENTAVVEGQISEATSVVNTNGYVVWLNDVPVGAASQGVAKRIIYRASTTAGPYKYVGEIADNTTTSFQDVMTATTFNAQTRYAVEDGTAPTPYTTIKTHKERLFFTDTDRSIIRWTEYANPYLSPAPNFQNLSKGDQFKIRAIAAQDDLITAFKDSEIWIGALPDPSDDLTWAWVKSPANMGIVGPKAFWEGPGYIVFMARSAAETSVGNIFGLCLLQGLDVQDAAFGPLRTQSISEKIEPEILAMPSTYWEDIDIMGFDNKLHIACALEDDTSGNAHVYWLDLNRIVTGEGQPGSWSLWDGINARSWVVHNGKLYAGDRGDTGFVRQLYDGTYTDDGSAINSYWYSKPLGGEASIDSWIKDFRWLNLWWKEIGTGIWDVSAKTEVVYDSTTGQVTSYGGDETLIATIAPVANPSLYGTAIYGTSSFYTEAAEREGQFSLGSLLGRRCQYKFSNGNTADQAFKVLSLKAIMNLRRQK